MQEFTFTMIKPDAVNDGHYGEILEMTSKAGFRLSAMKLLRITKQQAERFYAIHKERPFFNSLTNYMSSGNIIAAILEKNNAVEDFRKLIGATDPEKAEAGTIRKKFARSIEANAIHGSDSNENAAIEASFFFSDLERF